MKRTFLTSTWVDGTDSDREETAHICNCNNNDSINDDILSTIVNNVSSLDSSSHHNLPL